jgi:HEAT repeat protein
MLGSSYPDNRKLILLGGGFVALVVVVAVVLWCIDGGVAGARKLAKSADPQERHKAVERLRGRSSDAARQTLRLLSRDPDRWVAVRAIRALGENHSEANRRALVAMVTDRDLSARARGEAAATLGSFKDADPTVLAQALTSDPNAEARAGAAKGLLRMRNPKAIPELVQALEDRDPRVRIWAITAIHKMIARRFPYNAKLPPARQRQEIERIKAYLRRCGVL